MQKVIAIDGPSGVGKSTVARALAKALGWTYLDTGAMYRAVTYAWLQAGAKEGGFADPEWLASLALSFEGSRVFLAGICASEQIRTQEVTAKVSQVSAEPVVREFLTAEQRRIACLQPCILDGRDIGTVVFPSSFLKVFLRASDEERAKRRWLQLGGPQSESSLEEVLVQQQERDRKDSSRSIAPLKQADDAFVLDTDHLTESQVIERLCEEATTRLRSFSPSQV